MDWAEISSVRDIPKPRFDLRIQYMDVLQSSTLMDLIRRNADLLNALTQNNREQEQAMGALLLDATFIRGIGG